MYYILISSLKKFPLNVKYKRWTVKISKSDRKNLGQSIKLLLLYLLIYLSIEVIHDKSHFSHV